MKFKIRNFLILFLIMLPLGNFPQLFNFGEDTGSLVISFLVFPLFLLWILLEKKLYIPKFFYNKILTIILLIGLFLNIISLLLSKVDFDDGINTLIQFSLPKLIFIYLITVVAERINPRQSERILNVFMKIVIVSLILSIPLYFVNPIPEFVLYDGGTRFAGFHFELVNYTYVLLISFFIYSYNKKFSLIKFLLLLVFVYLSGKSNAFYPFVFMAFIAILFAKRNMIFFQKAAVVSIFLLTPIIGLFLEYFSFLEIFALRGSTSFSLEGSQLFVRLYPWALAMQHFIETLFMLPLGLGMLNISPYIEDTDNLFGGTGITAIIAEYGIISVLIVPLFILYFLKIIQILSFVDDINKRVCLTAMLILSITYICIQSGFFNFTAWSICIIIQTIALKYADTSAKKST